MFWPKYSVWCGKLSPSSGNENWQDCLEGVFRTLTTSDIQTFWYFLLVIYPKVAWSRGCYLTGRMGSHVTHVRMMSGHLLKGDWIIIGKMCVRDWSCEWVFASPCCWLIRCGTDTAVVGRPCLWSKWGESRRRPSTWGTKCGQGLWAPLCWEGEAGYLNCASVFLSGKSLKEQR